MCLFIVTTL